MIMLLCVGNGDDSGVDSVDYHDPPPLPPQRFDSSDVHSKPEVNHLGMGRWEERRTLKLMA